MRLLLVALSFLVQEKTAPQDSLLLNIKSKPDSVKAALYRDVGEQSFATPKIADSLGLLAMYWAKRTGQVDNVGRGAFIVAYANLQTKLPRALQYADTAIYYFEKANNPRWAGYVTRVLGVHLSHNESSLEAVEYLQRSSTYFVKSGDSALMVENYSSLSLLYHNHLQDFKLGLKYGLEAEKLFSKLKKQQPHVLWTLNNAIAINYDDSKEYDKALQYHFKNLKVEGVDSYNIATTNNNIGNTYRKQKQFAIAEPYFIKSLELHLQNRNDYSLATIYNNLSNINWDLGRPAKARMYRDSAIHYSLLSNNTEKLLDTYIDSYTMAEKNNDFKGALVYLKHYVEIKDSSMTAEKARIAYNMAEKYESERKQQQIALLQSEGKVKDLELERSRTILLVIIGGFLLVAAFTFLLYKRSRDKQRLSNAREREELQRRQYAAVLEAEENERSRVAKDLHDGIGQLLSTAKLTLSAMDEPTSAESNKMLNNSMQILDEATREVRAISHNLMPATLTQIGLGAALHDLFMKINESNLLRVNLNVTGLEERLPPSTEIAVYRVVQEIINNMIKHSKADTITVKIVRSESSMNLTIADNGIGFEKELISKSTGLGWKNIFSRISMLNGEIDVDSAPGSGTSINIQFSI